MNDDLRGNKLLITKRIAGSTDVFVVDPYFGDAHNLTRHPSSQDLYPVWSPDGSRIVFTSDRENTGTSDLYIMNADGGNVRRVTNVKPRSVCYFPTWTDDLIYFGYAPGDGSEPCIARISAGGSGFTVVGPGRDPAISPDGSTVAFTQNVGKGYCVFAMTADGTHVRQWTTHENLIGAVTPVWSPDGMQIVYSDQVGDHLELFVCGREGANQKRLTHLNEVASSGAWSPDGKYISFRVTDFPYWRHPDSKEYAYAEHKADKRPVWVIGADGSNPHVIEALHYHCALDGSRPVWKPREASK